MAQKGMESEKVMEQGTGLDPEVVASVGAGASEKVSMDEVKPRDMGKTGYDAPNGGRFGGDETDGDDFDDDATDGGELSDMEDTGVVVRREKFLSKERRQKYWGYFVTGTLRGRMVRVSLVSTDASGYDLLDIVFNGAESVALWRKSYELRDEKGEKTASGFTFYAVSLDEDGTVYTSQVKPSRKSDKALLEKIVELSMRSFKREVE